VTSSSYTPAPSPDITVEEYLQRLTWQGFSAAAAVAHLVREVREGTIELKPQIPDGSHIVERDGRFFVEIADDPPVSARNFICHVRSRAERLDYFDRLDSGADPQTEQPDPGTIASAPEPEPAVASSGGRDPEHEWERAACYVDERVENRGRPLDRHLKDNKPNIQSAADLMAIWFEKHDPKPPRNDSIRRWLNTKKNWPRIAKWWAGE
jgi:hypothetical protein